MSEIKIELPDMHVTQKPKYFTMETKDQEGDLVIETVWISLKDGTLVKEPFETQFSSETLDYDVCQHCG